MKISDVYPKKYITGEDLAGKAFTMTIKRVVIEQLHPKAGAPAEDKPVLYFDGTDKGVILGPVLARQMAEILGDETQNWIGKKITIFPQQMTVAGRACTTIRAKSAPVMVITPGVSEKPPEKPAAAAPKSDGATAPAKPSMTLETAKNIKTSGNPPVSYGDISDDDLHKMSDTIKDKLSKNGIKAEERDTYQMKLDSIALILEDRANKKPA